MFAHIIATYKISEHQMGVIVAVIQAVYELPAKCVRYKSLVWAERRNKYSYTTQNSAIMGYFSSIQVVSLGF